MVQRRNKTTIIILSLIAIALMYLLAPVLMPFLISALLAYLADPLVNMLTRLRFPRFISALIVIAAVYLTLLLLILLLVPLIEKQIIILIDTLPAVLAWIQSILSHLMIKFNIRPFDIKSTITNQSASVQSFAPWLGQKILSSGLALVGIGINLVLIPVVTFYLLRDWPKLLKNIQSLLPKSIEPTVTHLAKQCDTVLGAFLRGQLIVMLSLGIIYSVGLSLIGLSLGLIIGLLAGIANIVPYLGFIVGVSAASIAAYIQFNSWLPIAFVFLVFMIGQAIEGSILTPLLVGKRIGLHPVAVIFAVMTGGALFGFFGILLALPVASVVMVLLRYANNQYHKSDLYQATE